MQALSLNLQSNEIHKTLHASPKPFSLNPMKFTRHCMQALQPKSSKIYKSLHESLKLKTLNPEPNEIHSPLHETGRKASSFIINSTKRHGAECLAIPKSSYPLRKVTLINYIPVYKGYSVISRDMSICGDPFCILFLVFSQGSIATTFCWSKGDYGHLKS